MSGKRLVRPGKESGENSLSAAACRFCLVKGPETFGGPDINLFVCSVIPLE